MLQLARTSLQAEPNLVQREAEELQRQDLLELEQVPFAIEPIARVGMLRRREEADLVVEAERPQGDGRLLRELACLIEPLFQGDVSFPAGTLKHDVTSRSRGCREKNFGAEHSK
jgi:hypothetical protein